MPNPAEPSGAKDQSEEDSPERKSAPNDAVSVFVVHAPSVAHRPMQSNRTGEPFGSSGSLVARGETTVQIELNVPADQVSIGVYLRGAIAAENDPAPENGGPVFPVFNADQRGWSQVLLPLTAYPLD